MMESWGIHGESSYCASMPCSSGAACCESASGYTCHARSYTCPKETHTRNMPAWMMDAHTTICFGIIAGFLVFVIYFLCLAAFFWLNAFTRLTADRTPLWLHRFAWTTDDRISSILGHGYGSRWRYAVWVLLVGVVVSPFLTGIYARSWAGPAFLAGIPSPPAPPSPKALLSWLQAGWAPAQSHYPGYDSVFAHLGDGN